VLSRSTTLGSLKAVARKATTLFQPQPSGSPLATHTKIGFRVLAASSRPSRSDTCHGIERQSSSRGGCSSLCSFSNSATVSRPVGGAPGWSPASTLPGSNPLVARKTTARNLVMYTGVSLLPIGGDLRAHWPGDSPPLYCFAGHRVLRRTRPPEPRV